MTDDNENIAPGVTRQLATVSPRFAPFTSISGASASVLAGLSREDDSYRSIPMASVNFKSEGDQFVSPSFTLAIDDLAFVNLVLSTSVREIILAYADGAVSHMKEPKDVSDRLIGLAAHWEALVPVVREFAEKLVADRPTAASK